MSKWLDVANTTMILVGGLIAINQLRRASSKARLDYLQEMQIIRRELGSHYTNFLENFPILTDISEVSTLSAEQIRQAHDISDAVNEMAEMAEGVPVDRDVFYDFFHAHIIRIEFLLKPFLQAERARRGGRYGERLERVAMQARLYTHLYYPTKAVQLPRVPPVIVLESYDFATSGWRRRLSREGLRLRWKFRL